MAIRVNTGVSNEYVGRFGDSIKAAQGSMTFAGWFRRDTDNGAEGYLAHISNDLTAPSINRCAIYVDASDNLQLYCGSGQVTPFSQAATVGTWFYLAYSGAATTALQFIGTASTLTQIASTVANSGNSVYSDIRLGSYDDSTAFAPVSVAHFRVWTAALSKAELEAEMVSPIAVRSSGLLTAYEFSDSNFTVDNSGNGNTPTIVNASRAENYVAGPFTKLKLLAHPSAASAASIAGVVFQPPSGGLIAGPKLGEFTGESFEASLEAGLAVLKTLMGAISSAPITGSTPVALVRNTINTTGIVSCTLIEE